MIFGTYLFQQTIRSMKCEYSFSFYFIYPKTLPVSFHWYIWGRNIMENRIHKRKYYRNNILY